MGGIFVGVLLGACRWMRVRCVGVCLPRVCWRLPRSRPRPRPRPAMPAYFGGFITATVCASPATGGQPSALHFGGRRVRRLPCGARSRGPVAELAPFAALSFAQTAGDKSVHEARCARGPQALRSSAPKRRAAGCPPAAGLTRLRSVHFRTVVVSGPVRGWPSDAGNAANPPLPSPRQIRRPPCYLNGAVVAVLALFTTPDGATMRSSISVCSLFLTMLVACSSYSISDIDVTKSEPNCARQCLATYSSCVSTLRACKEGYEACLKTCPAK